jgi:uncharacterized membrane protein YphA (DoxX/SURF4 family)
MTLGTRLYGLAAITLGIPALIFGRFDAMGLPVPLATPAYAILVYAAAALLVVAGLAAQTRGTAAPAMLALAAFFAAGLLLLDVPAAVKAPTTWVSYEGIAEKLAMALGGLLAFAALTQKRRSETIRRVAPYLFGACLVVFGTSELVYSRFTATFVPAWLPPSQLFWAYVTGACQIAAGLAVLSGVLDRLAAILVVVMYLCFGLLIHLPRVIADPGKLGAWSEHGVNLVLAAAAWLLVERLRKRVPVAEIAADAG